MADMSSIYIQPGGGQIRCLFDHYTSVGNLGSTETDLYSDTIAGGTLATDGDKLQIIYAGTAVSGEENRIIRVYFGGTLVYESEGFAIGGTVWGLTGSIIRVSSSVIRYTFSQYTNVTVPPGQSSTGELTGLDLSTDNILKVTGETVGVGPATVTITATMGTVTWISHA